MSGFSILAILYMASFLCEMAENWRHLGPSWLFVVLISAIVFTRVTRLTFFAFLLASTAYVLAFRFPEVANHVNFFLLINVGLMLGLLRSWRRPDGTDESYLDSMLPFLRFSLVVVYAMAGLHKLNTDFLDSDVSCVGSLLVGDFAPMLSASVLGIPSVLLLAAAGVLLAGALLGHPLRRLPRSAQLGLLVAAVAAAGGLGALLVAVEGRLPGGLKAGIIAMSAVVVLAWELGGGLLLLVRRLQAPILLFSFVMHSSLALIGFVDFGSLAFTLLFAFIPPHYRRLLVEEGPLLELGGRRLYRVHVYFALLLLGGLLAGIHHRGIFDFGHMNLLHGLVFDFAAILLFWPVFSTLCSSARMPWQGVPVWTQHAPLFTLALVALMVLHGLTSYLGLRTAGNFSMFSNLRTEGATSNHLLFGSNPLKIWGYQEDAVAFLEIDDEAAKLGHKYVPLQDHELPVVEFRKLIRKWTQAGYVVPLTFEYEGRVHTTPDIVNDPVWRTDGLTWEMALMDFRVIQPEGKNVCRW